MSLNYRAPPNLPPPLRDVRAERVRVASDVEYVCKVHCIRLACHLLFAREDIKQFFANAGRQIIGDLMVRAAKVREREREVLFLTISTFHFTQYYTH